MAETIDQAQRQAEAKAAVTATLNSVGSSYDADLQSRASILQAGGESIARQEKDVQKGTQALAKHNDEFEKLISSTTRSLNEIGDVQNWAEMIERDLLVVEETLRLVEGRPESGNISGT
ncbi:hypothetical protein BDZ85DRAFT_43553 [Elsinoe ampelina]|uniref:Biogenesis of lysosome-related organelles complex 1 subunit 1 n=1 Tax=Elsinoe ampelina TaxID=302913 RepID=A0A6A6G1H5_9PEZI|nr:hypothetical protein BDZ85DRAFT_43553 [Elsinoe ampelina]